MKVVSTNIKSKPRMTIEKVREDINRAAGEGYIVFGQEISPKDYKRAWNNIMAHAGRSTFFRLRATPISLLESVWHVDRQEAVLVHKARAFVTPARYVVVLRCTHRKTGLKVSFINVHFISEVFQRKPGSFPKWRRQMWDKYWAALQQQAREEYRAGYNVVIAGDLNNKFPPPLNVGDSITVSAHGVDRIYAISRPAYKVKLNTEKVILARNLNTDHAILVADFDFVTRY